MKIWLYVLVALFLIVPTLAYTGNYSIEAELHNITDDSIITGNFSVNISIFNSSDLLVFSRVFNITTDSNGRFYEYLNISYHFSDNTYITFHVDGFNETNKTLIGEVPRATNSQYLQGRNWTDVENEVANANTSVLSFIDENYYNSTEINTIVLNNISDANTSMKNYVDTVLDNGSVVRIWNISWITDNQNYNTSQEIWDVVDNGTYLDALDQRYNDTNFSISLNTSMTDYVNSEFIHNLSVISLADSNITTTGTGFFGFLGTAISKIKEGWFSFLNADEINSTNVTTLTYFINNEGITDWGDLPNYVDGFLLRNGSNDMTGQLNGTSANFSGNVSGEKGTFTDFQLNGGDNQRFKASSSANAVSFELDAGGFSWSYMVFKRLAAAPWSVGLNPFDDNALHFNFGDGFGNDPEFKIYSNGSVSVRGNANLNDTLYVVDGNVGIGTSTPGDKLQIVGGNIRIGTGQSIRASSSSNDALILTTANSRLGSNKNVSIELDRNNDDTDSCFVVKKDGGTEEIMRACEDGNVGIGTQNPNSALAIMGNVSINQTIDNNAIHISGFDDRSSNIFKMYVDSAGQGIMSHNGAWEFHSGTGRGIAMLIGTTDVTMRRNMVFDSDDSVYLRDDGTTASVYWGNGNDANMYYDGTDLILNPKVVGNGMFNVQGRINATNGTFNKVGIGTSSPETGLHINNSGIIIENKSSDVYIELRDTLSNEKSFRIAHDTSQTELEFQGLFNGVFSPLMTLDVFDGVEFNPAGFSGFQVKFFSKGTSGAGLYNAVTYTTDRGGGVGQGGDGTRITYQDENGAGTRHDIAYWKTLWNDPTDGAEDSAILLSLYDDGNEKDVLILNDTVFNSSADTVCLFEDCRTAWPTGGGGDDTNETIRFDNLLGNCSSSEQVFGINTDGTKVCVADATGGGGGDVNGTDINVSSVETKKLIINGTEVVFLPSIFMEFPQTCGENADLDPGDEWSCGGNGEAGANLGIDINDSLKITKIALKCNTGTGTAVVRMDVNNGDSGCSVTSTGTDDFAGCDVDIVAGDQVQPFTVSDSGHANCVVTWQLRKDLGDTIGIIGNDGVAGVAGGEGTSGGWFNTSTRTTTLLSVSAPNMTLTRGGSNIAGLILNSTGDKFIQFGNTLAAGTWILGQSSTSKLLLRGANGVLISISDFTVDSGLATFNGGTTIADPFIINDLEEGTGNQKLCLDTTGSNNVGLAAEGADCGEEPP